MEDKVLKDLSLEELTSWSHCGVGPKPQIATKVEENPIKLLGEVGRYVAWLIGRRAQVLLDKHYQQTKEQAIADVLNIKEHDFKVLKSTQMDAPMLKIECQRCHIAPAIYVYKDGSWVLQPDLEWIKGRKCLEEKKSD